MGTFRVTIEVGAGASGPWQAVEALVDTGATFTQIPAPVLEALHVARRWRLPMETADGRVSECDVGDAWLRLDGSERPALVLFGEPGTEPLLGAHALEAFLLAPDPVHRRLVPVTGLRMTVVLDRRDRILLNHLQGGFPVSSRPFQEVGERLGMSEEEVIFRLRKMVKSGALSRFGPILNAPQLGGERTLAALHVPQERFEEVAAAVNCQPAVSHNYERDHYYNMWFVISSEDEADIARTLEAVERETGLKPINLPTLEEYFVELIFQLPVD